MGNGDGEIARPGADVEHARPFLLFGQPQALHHHVFSLRPRDQYGRVHFERQREELLPADQVGDWAALDPLADQLAELPAYLLGRFLVIARV